MSSTAGTPCGWLRRAAACRFGGRAGSASARSWRASTGALTASGRRPPCSAITATLYFVIFGSLIGRRVGQMGGFDYMQYIAPGLIMMAVITNSYGNVVSLFFSAKFQRFLEDMLPTVSPLPSWVIVAGYVGGGWRALLHGRCRGHGGVAAVHDTPPSTTGSRCSPRRC